MHMRRRPLRKLCVNLDQVIQKGREHIILHICELGYKLHHLWFSDSLFKAFRLEGLK